VKKIVFGQVSMIRENQEGSLLLRMVCKGSCSIKVLCSVRPVDIYIITWVLRT